AEASLGDRAPAYKRCVASCSAQLCDDGAATAPPPPPRQGDEQPWSSYSASLLWPCTDTCKYACQQHLTDLALAQPRSPTLHNPALQGPGGELEGLPFGQQVQFHGKWAFHRLDLSHLPLVPFLPLRLAALVLPRFQEPLSVLFSLANLWAHWRGLATLRTLARTARMTEGRRLSRVYAAYAVSGCLAWVASAVFHTRDTDATERADYFLAAGTMLVGLWAAVVRLQGWYAPSSRGARVAPSQRRAAGVWTLAVAAAFALHCTYLVRRERFDYAYNMQFNVVVALATIALWSAWVTRQATLPTPSNFSRRQLSSYPSARARFRAPHYLLPLFPLLALPALSALELLDFPPLGPGGLRLLDAHALWHLSTVPVVRAWYAFLEKDVRWIDGQGEGGDPGSVLPAAPSLSAASSAGARGRGAAAGASGQVAQEGARRRASLLSLERLQAEGRRVTEAGRELGLGIMGLFTPKLGGGGSGSGAVSSDGSAAGHGRSASRAGGGGGASSAPPGDAAKAARAD
ncbi:Per1-like-domain-containing protein, partial [Rhodotorula diobovata]